MWWFTWSTSPEPLFLNTYWNICQSRQIHQLRVYFVSASHAHRLADAGRREERREWEREQIKSRRETIDDFELTLHFHIVNSCACMWKRHRIIWLDLCFTLPLLNYSNPNLHRLFVLSSTSLIICLLFAISYSIATNLHHHLLSQLCLAARGSPCASLRFPAVRTREAGRVDRPPPLPPPWPPAMLTCEVKWPLRRWFSGIM